MGLRLVLKIGSEFKEAKVTIEAPDLNDDVQGVINVVREKDRPFLVGRKGEMQHILNLADIHFFHSEQDYVAAVTEEGSFVIKEKLYELEDICPSNKFIRLSKSAIANLYEMSHFEASFNGTLCVHFKSGKKEYVSRTYVPLIKETLKMNRRKS